VVDTEGGGFAAESIVTDVEALDIGWEGEIGEGGEEAYV
jgi:hypothetical protein